ncbi:MAG: ribonuclease III [Planctomycetaceae bacterium]
MTESIEWASGADRDLSQVEAALLACQERIDYRFQDRKLLRRCLTHSSCAATRLDCNERLEFLGDSVLGIVICEHLFQEFPDRREGQLTQQKSHLVSRSTCAAVADRLQLQELIFVGRGLRRIPDSVKAATTEALIAGIYLDGGLDAARRFILWAYAPELRNCSAGEAENYKSLLQEETQRVGNVTPNYVMVDQRGPDHAREFLVAAEVAGNAL